VVQVDIKGLERSFKDGTSIGPIDLSVNDGEMLTLLGPSGSGKTTTLRMVAGFINPDRGTLEFDGNNVTHLESRDRNIGMVVQSVALFPNMSVFQNIAFALDVAGWNQEEVVNRVIQLAELLDIQKLLNRRVNEISGGEGQRIALARALAHEPKLLLLDEPLSALDPQLRTKLQIEIRRIQKELEITTIYVTHSQAEAFSISDRIAILDNGTIQQVGTPEEIYSNPNNEFVANFISEGNILKGIIQSSRDGVLTVSFGNSTLEMKGSGKSGNEVIFTIKPERVQLEVSKGINSVQTNVLSAIPLVGEQRIILKCDEQEIVCLTRGNETDYRSIIDAVISIRMETDDITVLDSK